MCLRVSLGLCGGASIQLSPLFLYTTSFLFVIEHMMPLCMVISWVYSVAMMIQHIVTEKEHRLKEVGMVGEIPEEELTPLSYESCAASMGTFPMPLGCVSWRGHRCHIPGLSQSF